VVLVQWLRADALVATNSAAPKLRCIVRPLDAVPLRMDLLALLALPKPGPGGR
jgi:hypothetical protein